LIGGKPCLSAGYEEKLIMANPLFRRERVREVISGKT